MTIEEIFFKKAQQLSWGPIEDAERVGAPGVIEKEQAYFVVRLKEMYVAYSRKLWRKFYPMLYSFTEHGQSKENAVVGPGQLRELGEANLDRMVNLNQRLAGPTPYTGEDLSLLVGLYSVPGDDSAKALIETVSLFAALGGPTATTALEVANGVKSGVEKIMGLDRSQLQLGIRDTFAAGKPLRAGLHAGVSAPRGSVQYAKLFLRAGTLHQGNSPASAKPYQDHDYLVVEIEKRDTREDWPGLPGISGFQERFGAIMADSTVTPKDKRLRLREIWPEFQQVLASSKLLTRPDRENIADSVSSDLLARLNAIEGGDPFVETRSWGAASAQEPKQPGDFDLLDVPLYTDRRNLDSVRRAQQALAGRPFA